MKRQKCQPAARGGNILRLASRIQNEEGKIGSRHICDIGETIDVMYNLYVWNPFHIVTLTHAFPLDLM